MAVLTFADLAGAAGTDLGHSDWVQVDQKRIDGFADDTEDRQWIHTDPDRAAAGPFGGTIAHGYLTLSLTGSALAQLLEVTGTSAIVNYGLDRVRFPASVPVGSRIRVAGRITDVTGIDGGVQVRARLTTEADGITKPVCVADVLVRYLSSAADRGPTP